MKSIEHYKAAVATLAEIEEHGHLHTGNSARVEMVQALALKAQAHLQASLVAAYLSDDPDVDPLADDAEEEADEATHTQAAEYRQEPAGSILREEPSTFARNDVYEDVRGE